jgi:hypothetical protein
LIAWASQVRGFPFPLVEKPECAWKRDGIKQVRANGHHDINGAAFNDLLADVLFG